MKDIDQGKSTGQPKGAMLPVAELEQQLDELLAANVLGSDATDYPEDATFERLARAVESSVLAHDAAAPAATQTPLALALGSSRRNHDEDNSDLDWCLAAPLPLRSGEPTQFVASPARGSQLAGDDAVGAAAVGASAGPSAEGFEPSLQELAQAMLANTPATPNRAKPQPPTLNIQRLKRDVEGSDRISEIKPMLGPRPTGGLSDPRRVRAPQHSETALKLAAAPMSGDDHTRQPAEIARPNGSAAAPVAAQGQVLPLKSSPAVTTTSSATANEASATGPVDNSVAQAGGQRAKLAWLWSGLALAAAVVLAVQLDLGQQLGGGQLAHDPQLAHNQPSPPANIHSQDSLKQAAESPKTLPRAELTEDTVAPTEVAELPHANEEPVRNAAGSAAAGGSIVAGNGVDGEARAARAARAPGGTKAKGSDTTAGQTSDSTATVENSELAAGPGKTAAPGAALEPTLRPAARSSALPPQPSNGVATGAIGVVLPGARACVAGQFEPSRATVVFGSDGRVQRVEVSGPAAGTPAEPCIARVLGAARVSPFSDESFSVRTTVRP